MPKPSQINIKSENGTEGSFIDVRRLIDNRIVINILSYVIKESSVRAGSNYCIMQLKINGRPMITWHGSKSLIDYLDKCKAQEAEGIICFPIEECIIVENSNGSYALQDADESCIVPTAEELDELSSEHKHKTKRKFR